MICTKGSGHQLQGVAVRVAVLAGVVFSPVVAAGPTSDDSAAGMTCHYLASLPGMAWTQAGGDWVDVEGTLHGPRPFAQLALRRGRGAQRLEWDITTLARRTWTPGSVWPGALVLRGLPAGPGGTALLYSREYAEAARRPALELQYNGAQLRVLAPVADTHLSCPNHRSAGADTTMKLERAGTAVLAFELPADWARQLPQRVRLVMWSDKQYASGIDIGVFAAHLPEPATEPPQAGLAASYPADRGLESAAGVLLVERFEQAAREIGWIDRDDHDRVARTDERSGQHGFSPLQGNALEVTIPQRGNRGMDSRILLGRLLLQEPEELYFRYYLRLADNWDPVVDGGKLPGMAGTYGRAGWGGRRADGTNGWSARGSFARVAPESSALHDGRAIGSYVYHAGMLSRYGDGWGWNLRAAGWLQKGRWYSVEQQVKLNTPGHDDGVLRAWIDGRIAFENTRVRFRETPALRIETVWFNIYHGGAKPAHKDLTVFIDNLVVARQYIGPMAQAAIRKP